MQTTNAWGLLSSRVGNNDVKKKKKKREQKANPPKASEAKKKKDKRSLGFTRKAQKCNKD